MNPLELTAPGKLIAIIVVLVGSFGFIIANALAANGTDNTAAWATITLVTGYLIGNGVGAHRGETNASVWSPAGTAAAQAAAAEPVSTSSDRGDQ